MSDERPRCWLGRVEIPAADPARSARFYAEVFGWQAREVDGGDRPYFDLLPAATQAARRADREGPRESHPAPLPGAGVTAPAVLGADHPLAVIHVDGALGPVLRRVEAAGGELDLAPTPVPGHGTFARFRDPEGHLLGLWAARPHTASED